jgi:hypothetical protein
MAHQRCSEETLENVAVDLAQKTNPALKLPEGSAKPITDCGTQKTNLAEVRKKRS